MSKGAQQQNLSRQLGLATRYLVEGGTSFPMTVGDAANNMVNFLGQGIAAKTGTEPVHLGPASSALSQLLTNVGLPQPQGPLEKAVGEASKMIPFPPKFSGMPIR